MRWHTISNTECFNLDITSFKNLTIKSLYPLNLFTTISRRKYLSNISFILRNFDIVGVVRILTRVKIMEAMNDNLNLPVILLRL